MAPYLTSAFQLSDELAELLEGLDELGELAEPSALGQARLDEALEICKRSVREAREAWETKIIEEAEEGLATIRSIERDDC